MAMDSQEAFDKAMATRQELQARARGFGVSEEYISILVDTFYDKVRGHAELGGVFNRQIEDRWPAHLSKMKTFWASVALRDGQYKGRPMMVHKQLSEAKPEHFAAWMMLFEETLRETAPNDEVAEYFLGFAETMSRRFQAAMFPRPHSARKSLLP